MNTTLRSVEPDDEAFPYRLYASARSEELAPLPWTEEQKEAFLKMQFDAQSRHYREHYPDADFRVIMADGKPGGRLYAARWPEEIRIVDISLLPEHRAKGIGTTLLRELVSEADASGKPLTIHVGVSTRRSACTSGSASGRKRTRAYTSSWNARPLVEDRLVEKPPAVRADGYEEKLEAPDHLMLHAVDAL